MVLIIMKIFLGILPAPNNVHYNNIIEDPAGLIYLQISWEPPTLASDELGSQNISVDFRITHFIIYITNESTTTVYSASGTSFAIETDEISCNFWFQVAAVNPAGVGERSSPQIFDGEFACMIIIRIFLHLQYDFLLLLIVNCRVYGFHRFNYSH